MKKLSIIKTEEMTNSWRVYTAGLLKEILSNDSTQTLRKPLQIFANILAQVGERAAELNDAKLNALMCRLAIYSISDPESKDYDFEMVEKILSDAKITNL